MERKNVCLRLDAVPRIFKGLPAYLSTPTVDSRGSPSKRRRKVFAAEEARQTEWLDSDIISTHRELAESVHQRLESSFPAIQSKDCGDHILLYKLEHTEDTDRSIVVAVTIRLLQDMTVSLFLRVEKLPGSELNWTLSQTDRKLRLWSQLNNILARYAMGDVTSINYSSRSKMIASTVESLECATEEQQHAINFLAEQLKLTFALPKGRRYSIDMLLFAFTLYHKSPACYLQVLNLLCLPSVRLLKALSANLNIGEGNVSVAYLKRKAQLLAQHKKLVNIQLDETHIKSKISYQNGKVFGNAENHEQKAANRIQCFLISSVLSSNKDVVSLIPVHKMTTDDLTRMTLDVIKIVTTIIHCSYTIVSILSGNNIVNRKMFMQLSHTDHLVP